MFIYLTRYRVVEPGRFKVKQGGVLWFLEMRVCFTIC